MMKLVVGRPPDATDRENIREVGFQFNDTDNLVGEKPTGPEKKKKHTQISSRFVAEHKTIVFDVDSLAQQKRRRKWLFLSENEGGHCQAPLDIMETTHSNKNRWKPLTTNKCFLAAIFFLFSSLPTQRQNMGC